jgi:hypothetical protein
MLKCLNQGEKGIALSISKVLIVLIVLMMNERSKNERTKLGIALSTSKVLIILIVLMMNERSKNVRAKLVTE